MSFICYDKNETKLHDPMPGGVPKDVPNRPLHKLSYGKGVHGQEAPCSLEFLIYVTFVPLLIWNL